MNKKNLKVSIVMGSQSDFKTMKLSKQILKKLKVPLEIKIISAHRTPMRMYKYASDAEKNNIGVCLLYTSPSPRDRQKSRMPSSA